MVDQFYRGTLTTSAVINQLTSFLETQLQDSGDTYQLSNLLASVAVGSFVDNGTIQQTDDGYIVDVNGVPYAGQTILLALSQAIADNPLSSSIVNFVGSSLIDAIFGNDFESDTRILDADGNIIAGVYSEDPAGQVKIESVLAYIESNNLAMNGDVFTVRIVSDVENPSTNTSNQYLIDSTAIQKVLDQNPDLGDFVDWNFGGVTNSDKLIANTSYLLVSSLDSDELIFQYKVNSDDFEYIQVSWNDIDISGSQSDYKIHLIGSEGGSGNNLIFGTDNKDFYLMGGEGQDTIFGFEGDDTFEYQYRSSPINALDGDVYHGGYYDIDSYLDGSDTIDYSEIRFNDGVEGVRVQLNFERAYRTGYQNVMDSLYSIENVVGSDYNDNIDGSEYNNIFYSTLGDDRYSGRGGFDRLTYLNDYKGVSVNIVGDGSGYANKNSENDDTFYGIESITTTNQSDNLYVTIAGNFSDASLADGDDNIYLSDPNNKSFTINGGDGFDTVYLYQAFGSIDINDYIATTSGNVTTISGINGANSSITLVDVEDVKFLGTTPPFAGALIVSNGNSPIDERYYLAGEGPRDLSYDGDFSVSTAGASDDGDSRLSIKADLAKGSLLVDRDLEHNYGFGALGQAEGRGMVSDRITIQNVGASSTDWTEFDITLSNVVSGFWGTDSVNGTNANSGIDGIFGVDNISGHIEQYAQSSDQWVSSNLSKNRNDADYLLSNPGESQAKTHHLRFLGDSVSFDVSYGVDISSGAPLADFVGQTFRVSVLLDIAMSLPEGIIMTSESGVFLTDAEAFVPALLGNDYSDDIIGQAPNEELFGLGGDDNLYGYAGEDLLNGGANNDQLYGGLGNDSFVFDDGFGNDTIHDFVSGEQINLSSILSILQFSDLAITASGTDSLITVGSQGTILVKNIADTYWSASDFVFSAITGTSGDDTIYGTSEADRIFGFEGSDYILGNDGNDEIYGGDGDDYLYGNGGTDTIYGEAGEDIISGHAESDTIYGGDDNDKLYGYESSDLIYGGSGSDKIYGDDQDGLDTYTLGGADEIHGEDGNDQIFAGIGDDLVYGDAGDDDIYGHAGNDTIYGGSNNDRLYGGDGNDIFYGGDDSDTVWGGNGDDIIIGGNGRDYLNGEAGADTFYLDLDEVDRIRDFDQAEGDRINIADLLDGFDSGTDDVNDFVDIVIRSSTRTDIRVDEDGQGGNFQYVGIIYGDLTGETVDSLVASGALITE